jgi:hypothetical protein
LSTVSPTRVADEDVDPPPLEAGFVALALRPFGLIFSFLVFLDFLGDGEEDEEELELSLELELELSLEDPELESESEFDPEDDVELEPELESESELRLELSELLLLFRPPFESELAVSKSYLRGVSYLCGPHLSYYR